MENNNQAQFNITQEYEIIPRAKSQIYTIDIDDWNHIKTKLSKIKETTNLFDAIGFLFLGCFTSSLIGYFTSKELKSNIMLVIIGFSLVIGIICIIFSYFKRKSENNKPKDIIDHMCLIELKFRHNQ